MSQYITVFDDNKPVIYLNGEPWANLTQMKESLPLHEICDMDIYIKNGQEYIQYTVKANTAR